MTNHNAVQEVGRPEPASARLSVTSHLVGTSPAVSDDDDSRKWPRAARALFLVAIAAALWALLFSLVRLV